MKLEKQYFIANILLLLAFLGVVFFLLFFREHIVCPYKANGLTCPTCGLSRTILALTGQDQEFQPSTTLVFLATYFLGQFVLRLVLLIVSLFKVKFSKKWIIGDGVISFCWFVSVMVPFY